MGSIDKVKVAVRVRPFNRREIDLGAKCVVDMDKDQTILFHPSVAFNKDSEPPSVATVKKEPKTFAFDHCFWSMDESNEKFANQEIVFNYLGKDLLERAFEGYNACIFAYGQTGSGKSYSMMGTNEQKGIIPRLCDVLFDQIKEKEANDLGFKVEVSYMEIYNEKVRDLLDPKGRHNLRVREHNILGPYVDDLSTLAVSAFQDINTLMSEGNKSRTVAATNMNSESSRSHAVFNIIVTQTLSDLQTGVSGEKVSKMSLVDLAGSERAQKTGAVGERLKEGSNINKSLTTLGLVISALADQASGKSRNKFVPYRDSTLTWLLKDNLGGNSKTVMVATVSPAADNYEETLSTLRYADRAKRIVNHAVVNEDPNARIIRELRSEVEELKKQLDDAQSTKTDVLREKLEESEKLMCEISKTWEEKLKETEKMHQERTAALEKMGISVETSGIKVEQCKFYLVNLNADPSLNELLVYYLKDRTMVGRSNAPTEQDIQLSGLGITTEHCIIDIDHNDVYITPLEGARTCVNGRSITTKTRVKHGDRILWGNNHFFRINCPKANSPCSETPENIDYDFAQQELMMQQFMNDPIQEAITSVEKQHEEDKQEALERQRQMYERQMWMLRNQLMSPGTPSTTYPPIFDPFTKFTPMGVNSGNSMHPKYQQWVQEREKLFKQSLAQLKEEMMKANVLVREANFLAQEMAKDAEFSVTLQIPAANLSPNRKRGAFVTEPAILMKQSGGASQVWDMDKFENKVIDMRDFYQEWKEKDHQGAPLKGDPFNEAQESHNLIGVANVFLEALFYDVKLDYQVPIINQQGEVSGRLHIELCRVAGVLPEKGSDEGSSESSGESGSRNGFTMEEDGGNITVGNTIVCQVRIKEARGLPPTLANFVFCQYIMWGYPEPIGVPPVVHSENNKRKKTDDISIKFDHCKQFTIPVTEEFLEHCTEGALSIEVWGHSQAVGTNVMGWELDQVQAKSRSILDRWIELTRKIEVCVEIHELSEQGEYVPVEVVQRPEVLTGGVYQLRQGHSRRLLVQVKPVHNSGTLPIICESITLVQIGCVCARSHLQKGLDSYQEEDLSALRKKWSEALSKRREYLDGQLKKIMSKEDKTAADLERERSLIDQWVRLTEERNAVLVPAAGSIIPGAPADWSPPVGMEQHIPVIFLDLNADDMSTPNVKEGMQAAGINSILPKEHGTKFYTLPFVKNSEKEACAVISWDSSIHDSVHLNRVTPNNERICLIVKIVVRLSHPASMEVVLRKRVSINVYKRQSITEKLKKRIGKADSLYFTAVTYEIVSNIPKASEDLEDRESLAQIAASQNEQNTADGETYIEKYIRGVSAFESVLTLDRLRQEVTIKELLAARGKPLRKSTSVPNINNMLTSPRGIEEMIRADSIQDIAHPLDHDRFSLDLFRHRQSSEFAGESSASPNKSFNLARPNFLNLRTNICSSSSKPSSMSGLSPQPTKLAKAPLKTLLEEQYVRETKPLLREPSEESDDEHLCPVKPCGLTVSPLAVQPAKTTAHQTHMHSPHSDNVESDDFQEYQEFQATCHEDRVDPTPASSADISEKSHSAGAVAKLDTAASDSLAYAAQVNNFAPSMASSGYASQAVSIQTLSSEDSGSVKSIGTDDILVDVSMVTVDKKTATGGSEDAVEKEGDCRTTMNVSSEKEELTEPNEGESCESLNVNKDLRVEETLTTNEKSSISEVELHVSEDCQSDGDDDLESTGGVNRSRVSQAEHDNLSNSVPMSGETSNALSLHEDEAAVADIKGEAQSSLSEKPAEENVDVYSETAMEELERLSDTTEDTPTMMNMFSSAELTGAQSNTTTNESDKTITSPTKLPNEQCSDPVITNKVKLRRKGSVPRNTQSRRSLNVELESSMATTENGGRYPEIKTGVDFAKGTSFKKLRPMAESRPSKSTPSPVKATYRPVSMTQEMMTSLEEAMQHDTEEAHNSGGEEDAMSVCSFGSRADLHRLGEVPVPSWVLVGEPVMVLFSNSTSKPGTVQFIGQTEFASGNWVGVSLDQPEGKNDGSVKGIRYFRCRPRHGIFVRHDKLIMDKKRRNSKTRSSPLHRSTGNLFSPSPQKEAASSLGGLSPANSFMKATAASSAKHK